MPSARWGANLWSSWYPSVFLFPMVGPAIWSASRGRRTPLVAVWATVCTAALAATGALLLVPRNERGAIPQVVGTTWGVLGGLLFVSSLSLVARMRAERKKFLAQRPFPAEVLHHAGAVAEAEAGQEEARRQAMQVLAGWTPERRAQLVMVSPGDGRLTGPVWARADEEYMRRALNARGGTNPAAARRAFWTAMERAWLRSPT